MSRFNAQSGNVLFLILIAAALFAALSYAVTASTRQTPGDTMKESTNLAVARTLNYVSVINLGMARLKAQGLATNEIDLCDGAFTSCDNGIDGGNPVCTTGSSCLFSSEGGGVIFQELPQEIFANEGIGGFSFGEAATSSDPITAATLQNGVPVNAIIDQNVCLDINEKLGIDISTVPVGNMPDGYDFACTCIGLCPERDGSGNQGTLRFEFSF